MQRSLAIALLIACAAAASCSTPRAAAPAPTPEPAATATATPSAQARAWLREFGATYSYDVGYLEQLLDLSPGAYEAFAQGMKMAEHREHLSVEAHRGPRSGRSPGPRCARASSRTAMGTSLGPSAYANPRAARGFARLRAHYVGLVSALLADDCGQCTQLNLRMAVEEGVDRATLRMVLEDPARLPTTLRMVHDYAGKVVAGENAPPELVAALRRDLGDAAFAELAVNVLGARIYPALRRAMGAERACPPPGLDF